MAVDGRGFTDGSASRGAGTYLRQLLAGLASAPDTTPVVVVERAAMVPDGADVHPLSIPRLPRRLQGAARDLALPGAVGSVSADVWFSPGQHPPRQSPMPVVQSLLDVIPLEFRHPLLRRDEWRWRFFAPRFRRADRVIAISRHTADAGARHLGLDPSRIRVVHLAAADDFHPPTTPPDPPPQPYLLYVGAWGPHKGFAEACALVAELADRGFGHRLRLVGPGDDMMRRQVADVVSRSPRPDLIDQVGFAADLLREYHGADALVVTSRVEGFCLPAVEAMACGTPVVAFDNSALPEVIADGGTLVADGDVAAMACAVSGLLGSVGAREEASGRALARAKAFDWSRTVEAHVDVLHEAASR